MSDFVLDASVVVKWFLPEPHAKSRAKEDRALAEQGLAEWAEALDEEDRS